ncbi:integrin alpha [bacterium]|nr:integrin alpha [bacterium]
MPNREHNFRARFSSNKVELEPRDKSIVGVENTWNWQWQTVFIGRAGAMHPTGESRIQANNNRVEYIRDELIEWYENKPEGLEQGFILKSSPRSVVGEVLGKPVRIVSQPIEGLEGRVDIKGRFIEFINNQGAVVLKYAKLKAWDARGRKLQASMALENHAIVLSINDQGAHYPIMIDPLLTTPAWTAESNQEGAAFGYSVASAGDVNGDGYSDVIVSATGYDNGESNEGRVYAYLGSTSGLAINPIWTAESNAANASFGFSVGSAGDVNDDGYGDIIIGASTFSNGQSLEGRAYIYLGSVTGLASTPDWTAESNQDQARFGTSVSSAGDVNGDGYGDVIVGAQYFDNGEDDEGRAYVYLGSATGLSATANWTAESNQAYAQFGISVSSAGDVNGDGYGDVIVGAYLYDNEPVTSQTNEGRVYVYLGSLAGLAVNPAWIVDGDQEDGNIANAVSSAGDVNGDGYSDVIVGAKYYNNGLYRGGRVFVYPGSSSGLSTTPVWTANGDQLNVWFGHSIGNAGDVNGDGYGDVIVSALNYNNGESGEGRAFIYQGSSSGLDTNPIWVTEGNQIDAKYGCSVSSAGDVNGDGYSDVIVGALEYDNGETNEGRAYVYHGSSSGLTSNAVWTAESNQTSAQLGYCLASAGDVNGDGYGDVMLGVPYYDTGLSNIGNVFIFHGKSDGLSTIADQILEGTLADEFFGFSVSTAGDVNGDGFCDIVVGSPQYSNGETNEGRAYVYLGNASGVGASPAWTVESNQANAQLGYSVACTGDVNGDGYSDILLGAPYYDNQGRVYLHTGSASGLDSNSLWFADGGQVNSQFGYSVSSAGDVNGDGFSDVIIGEPLYDNGQTDEGRAFLYLGHAGGLSSVADWSQESDQTNAQYGHSVASAGDVNSDGYSDVVVGANLYDGTQSNEGRVYIYHGGSGGLGTNFSWTAYGGQNSVQFGYSVATAGDVDNDGYGDVVVGAYQFPNGRAYVYHGSSSGLVGSAEWAGEGDQAG